MDEGKGIYSRDTRDKSYTDQNPTDTLQRGDFGEIRLDQNRTIIFREVFWEGSQRFDIRVCWNGKFTRKGVIVPPQRMLEFAEIVQRMAQFVASSATPSSSV